LLEYRFTRCARTGATIPERAPLLGREAFVDAVAVGHQADAVVADRAQVVQLVGGADQQRRLVALGRAGQRGQVRDVALLAFEPGLLLSAFGFERVAAILDDRPHLGAAAAFDFGQGLRAAVIFRHVVQERRRGFDLVAAVFEHERADAEQMAHVGHVGDLPDVEPVRVDRVGERRVEPGAQGRPGKCARAHVRLPARPGARRAMISKISPNSKAAMQAPKAQRAGESMKAIAPAIDARKATSREA
jgi:hypothetical protein